MTTDRRTVSPAGRLAHVMHPRTQSMVLSSVEQVSRTCYTFTMRAADGHELAYFRAGQYIPIFVEVGGNVIERPYALSSSPEDSVRGFYQITVERVDDGFISRYICDNWRAGDKVTVGPPRGSDYHTPLRDAGHVIAIAGGVGATPFHSMARAIADGTLEHSMTLFYGAGTWADVMFPEKWERLKEASHGRFDYAVVLETEDRPGTERGFITLDLIRRYTDVSDATFFASGSQAMMDHVRSELAPLGLPRRRMRLGIGGDSALVPAQGEACTITVHQAGETFAVPGRTDETILKSLEKYGLRPAVSCRSGVCGWCRAYLIRGDAVITEDESGSRRRDKALGYLHPCCSYPAGDLEIAVQRP